MSYTNTAVEKNWRELIIGLTLLLLAGFSIPVESNDSKDDAISKSIRVAEYLQSEPEYSIFVSALQKSGYWGEVKAAKAITIFVAGDIALRDEGSAFLLQEVLQKPENKSRLDELISLHVVANGFALQQGTTQSEPVKTIAGSCLTIEYMNTAVRIGPEAVLKKSIAAENGLVYEIDRLLWLPYKDELASGNCR